MIEQVPQLAAEQRAELRTIGGHPPDPADLGPGCPFAPRCPSARAACAEVTMELLPVADAQLSACPFSGDVP